MNRPLGEKFQSAALTDVGRTRSENQDACALFTTKGDALVGVVADGMGGHAGGATASRIAIETLHDLLNPTQTDVDGAQLADAIEQANDRIHRRANEDPELNGMGTTIVALLIRADGAAWVAHVGDSRAYRLRAGRFEALTHDHSFVAELVRTGAISEAEAEVDPRRNEILRSVGAASTVDVDLAEVSISPGDRYLLCSDGLTGPVPTTEIEAILGACDPEDATRSLIARANDAGSPDNITAVAFHYPDPHGVTDTRRVVTAADIFEAEAEVIDVQDAEEKLVRARRLLILTAIIGVALLLAVVGVVLTSAPVPQPVSVASPPFSDTESGADPLRRPQIPTEADLPYELEPQVD